LTEAGLTYSYLRRDREVSSTVRNRADVRTICFVAAYFVALGLAWALPVARTGLTCGAVALLCWLSWINAVITHNVVHTPVWRSKALNRATRVALSLTYGFPVSDYVPGHNLSHHRYTQTRRDVMRTSKVRFRWNLLNLLALFPAVAVDVARANARYVRFARERRPDWVSARRLEVLVTWGVKLSLLALDWRKALLFVFLPHLGAVWGVTTVNFLWHDGCDAEHPYNHSRNFVGAFFNWFHFNAGYHGMHHHAPGLHWSLLPRRHAESLHPFIHPALEQRSLLLYLFRTFVLEGRRRRYDGAALVVPEEGPDEDWIGASEREEGAAGAGDHQDAAPGARDETARDASQKNPRAALPVRADHDEIGPQVVGHVLQLVPGRPATQDELDVDVA
jgi:fatty acid desaturase